MSHPTLTLVLAVIGAGLIGLGSAIGIAAPGDGQTGMCLFPVWLTEGRAA